MGAQMDRTRAASGSVRRTSPGANAWHVRRCNATNPPFSNLIARRREQLEQKVAEAPGIDRSVGSQEVDVRLGDRQSCHGIILKPAERAFPRSIEG
jgi:hypothetical protein